MRAAATRKTPLLPYERAPVPAPSATDGLPAGAADVPALELRGVSKGYGSGRSRTQVLANVDLAIAEGEFVAIVGFSGSGKTTLINLLAGLADPDGGEVLKGGRPVRGPGPDRGVVFQSYSLMPWLTVIENVALAVDSVFGDRPGPERRARVDRYVAMVGLADARDKRPAQLSGGMRQRVAVARALAANPDVLLLDEPLSALDALTRAKLQDEIVRIWSQDRKTVVLITNDVDEALMLADRILPLDPGPRATLGPSFAVDIPRPRDRRELNHQEGFKRLRAAITQYLLEAGNRRLTASGGKVIRLPALKPDPAARSAFGGLIGARRKNAAQPARERHGDDRYVEFSRVGKVYPTSGGPQQVVDGFDLKIANGEFISIIGHSGCGKSTVLSMTAGLTGVTEGGIILDGREVSGAGPDPRALAYRLRERRPRRRAGVPAWRACRAARHGRVLPRAGGPRRRDAQARLGALERHEAAGGHRARVRARPEAAPARRAVRHARLVDALGAAGGADGGLGTQQGHRRHGHARRRRSDPARRPGGDDDERAAGQGRPHP